MLLLFLVTRHSCLGDHAARANTSSLAAFAVTLFSSFYIVADVLSTLLLFALSKLCIPIKKTLCYPKHIVDHDGYAPDINPMPIFKHKNPFGGDGGIRTPVQNTFLVASYNHNQYDTGFLFRSQVFLW